MKKEDLISKWLNGELTESELEALKTTREYHNYKDIIRFSEKLPKPEFDQEKGWQDLTNRLSRSTPVKKLNFSVLYKIAAVVVVVFASGLFFWLNQPEVLTTGNSEVASLRLPDASVVELNAGSRIRYKPSKWEQQRKIELSGEAFFKVEKGQRFTVETTQGSVTVLGTQFNVKDRPGFFEVSCYEGAVEVSINNNELILEKGNTVRVVDGDLSEVYEVGSFAPSWTFKESTFDRIPLHQVVAEFERQYGVAIELKNVDPDQLFTGSFSHDDKELALKAITVPLQLRYELQSDKKIVFYAD